MPPTLIDSRDAWNALVTSLPHAHVLQSWEWGDFKSRHAWQVERLAWMANGRPAAAAALLIRRVPMPGFGARLSVAYVPKGPLLDWSDDSLREQVLDDLLRRARHHGAIFLKIDPDVVVRTGGPSPEAIQPAPLGGRVAATLAAQGWTTSREQVQFRTTVLVDVQRDDEALLAAMKSKTRYNIRLAARHGVRVDVPGDNGPPLQATLDVLYQLYAETSRRDGFAIRPREYYADAWGSFIRAGLAQALVASVDDQPVAAVVLFRFAGKAWYMYGMSRAQHRERMPNHLLQWEAMRWARAHGCTAYDLWGAPETFDATDPLWGVWKFKEGFGGQLVQTLGAWDFPLARPWYQIYTRLIPLALGVMRRRRS